MGFGRVALPLLNFLNSLFLRQEETVTILESISAVYKYLPASIFFSSWSQRDHFF